MEKKRMRFAAVLSAVSILLTGLSVSPVASEEEGGIVTAGQFIKPETTRETIDLGATPWKFLKADDNPAQVKLLDYDDTTWQNVGVPHCFNDMDTFTNSKNITMYKGTVWYRKKFTVPQEYEGRKLFIEFQGVNIGAAVYVNGTFKEGNTTVAQPGEVTHVGGFLPFTLDVTNDIKYGEENIIAVRVSNASGSFFTWPGFGSKNDFGMGYGGIICPVYLHITDPVHVPSNVYSPMEKWGTYVATTALSQDKSQATIRMQTNVENEKDENKNVTLSTQIVDADGNVALSFDDVAQTITPGQIYMFDQTGTINNPKLWYPAASIHGTPHMYKVYSIVKVDGNVVDVFETPLGIRVITWDSDYCYINGEKHLMNGFGNRNTYPALGSAIPEELLWRDIALIAEAGGNTLRVGHVPATAETVAACDAYGVMVMQNSGDDEWSLFGDVANAYKKEYDRDMIIRDRNNPSITVWEANNGTPDGTSGKVETPKSTWDSVNQYDYLAPRLVHSRDKSDFNPPAGSPNNGKLMIGYTNWFWKNPNYPSINSEVYGAKFSNELDNAIARFDYDNEKQFVDYYVKEWFKEINEKAVGFIDWMLVETWGEGYTKYLNGMRNQKSLGSSAMDGNRIPKLKYKIWQNAIWMPYEVQPGVTLQSHWQYAIGSRQTIDAWSNCPKVELFINDISQGIKEPDEYKRFTWSNIRYNGGTIKAVGLDVNGQEVCSDIKEAAGIPKRIELSVQPMLTRPDGGQFELEANGSDVAIIEAKIVDENGVWQPLADDNLTFTVSGPASYRGSYNFYVVDGKPVTYHAPGDLELQAEGGLMKIAVRTGFTAGEVTVTVSADELDGSQTTFTTKTVENQLGTDIPVFNLSGHSLEGGTEASLEPGDNDLWFKYQNNTENQLGTLFVITLKKDGVIQATKSEAKTFAPFEEYTFVNTLDIPEIQDSDNYEISAYLWASGGMEPLYGKVIKKIINTPPIIILNDTDVGDGINQIKYINDWGYSGNEQGYMSDNHWTFDSDRECIVRFEGVQISYWGIKGPDNGIVTISVDGGPEVEVDLYGATNAPSAELYISPVLPYGEHTLRLRATGRKNASANSNAANVDRFDIRTR